MAIFPGEPGLAGTRMSPFWMLLELRMMEVVVITGAIRRAKLQSNRQHQQTSTQLLTGWMPFLSPNKQCQSTEGRIHHYSLPMLINNQTCSATSRHTTTAIGHIRPSVLHTPRELLSSAISLGIEGWVGLITQQANNWLKVACNGPSKHQRDGRVQHSITKDSVYEVVMETDDQRIKVTKIKFTIVHYRTCAGAHLTVLRLEHTAEEPVMSVPCNQCKARPTATFAATKHHCPSAGWYQIILLGDRGRVWATWRGLHLTAERPGFEPAICWSQVQRPNYSAIKPDTNLACHKKVTL